MTTVLVRATVGDQSPATIPASRDAEFRVSGLRP